MSLDPALRELWNLDTRPNRDLRCDQPCCELARVASTARHVTSEDELREALTKPEVFWW